MTTLRFLFLTFVLLFAGCSSPEDAMYKAAESGDLAKVQKLLAKNPALAKTQRGGDAKGRTPLHFAATRAIAEALVAAGADLHAKDGAGNEPIHVARSEEVVDYLIEKGVDPHALANGLSAMHTAESSHACAALVRHGLPLDVRDKNGRTPVHQHALKATAKDLEVLGWLIDSGADVHAMDNKGETPLHVAAAGAVTVLTGKGVFVDVQDKYGGTPLHHAVLNNELAKAEALLKAGASTSVKLNRDTAVITVGGPTGGPGGSSAAGHFTPLQLAKTNEMKNLLRKYGAAE